MKSAVWHDAYRVEERGVEVNLCEPKLNRKVKCLTFRDLDEERVTSSGYIEDCSHSHSTVACTFNISPTFFLVVSDFFDENIDSNYKTS